MKIKILLFTLLSGLWATQSYAQTVVPLPQGVPGTLKEIGTAGVAAKVGAERGHDHGDVALLTVLKNGTNTYLIYPGKNVAGDVELYSTNAATLVTTKIEINTAGSSNPDKLTLVGNRVYFTANNGDLNDGNELWVTDGTVAGTFMVANINEIGNSDPQYLAKFGNKVIFRAVDEFGDNSNPTLRKYGLWIADENGATRLASPSVVQPVKCAWGKDELFQTLGNICLFVGKEDMHGSNVWVTDGTKSGTRMVLDINFYPVEGGLPGQTQDNTFKHFFKVNDKQIAFSCEQSPGFWLGYPLDSIKNIQSELWVTDGTACGTYVVRDLNSNLEADGTMTMNSYLGEFQLFKNKAFFRAHTDWHPWNGITYSDMTYEGTGLFVSINQRDINGLTNSSEFDFQEVLDNDLMFFRGQTISVGNPENDPKFDSLVGKELFYTDGTAAGTFLYADIVPGAVNSEPMRLKACNDKMYFVADDGSGSNRELHCALNPKKNGGVKNYYRVIDLPGNADPLNLTSIDGVLYFISTVDGKLYQYDDGAAVKVKDIDNYDYSKHKVPATTLKNKSPNCIGTSNKQSGFESELIISPVPAKSALKINISNFASKQIDVVIFDMSGRCVMMNSMTNNSALNVSTLNKGIYIVAVNGVYRKLFTKE